ncbi:hypothetical protein SSP531S_24050 [Streptomyces spongiicola]|uniref:Uncharacterized protein n=1 Tax=Streptomyces spongiicola TaxID=1690221 RepID=A0A388SWP3_9ACTN|nr:hypothetical protein SSP531S_24050 [Streptomyces spongiicola]
MPPTSSESGAGSPPSAPGRTKRLGRGAAPGQPESRGPVPADTVEPADPPEPRRPRRPRHRLRHGTARRRASRRSCGPVVVRHPVRSRRRMPSRAEAVLAGRLHEMCGALRRLGRMAE